MVEWERRIEYLHCIVPLLGIREPVPTISMFLGALEGYKMFLLCRVRFWELLRSVPITMWLLQREFIWSTMSRSDDKLPSFHLNQNFKVNAHARLTFTCYAFKTFTSCVFIWHTWGIHAHWNLKYMHGFLEIACMSTLVWLEWIHKLLEWKLCNAYSVFCNG